MELLKSESAKKIPGLWLSKNLARSGTIKYANGFVFENTNILISFHYTRHDSASNCCYKEIYFIVNKKRCCFQCGLKKGVFQRFCVKIMNHLLLLGPENITECKKNSRNCDYCDVSLWCTLPITKCKTCEMKLYDFVKTEPITYIQYKFDEIITHNRQD